MGMIPIGDENVQGGPPPLVNWALIALNVLAFFLELAQPSEKALQSFITSGSSMPSVGASGAISGVLGGYLLLFPRNRVRVMTRGGIMAVPAFVMLGLWILIQFVSGMGALARTEQTGGVAYMAHIGGFVAGLALVKLFAAGRTRPAYA